MRPMSPHTHRGSGLGSKEPGGVWHITECDPLTTEPGCFEGGRASGTDPGLKGGLGAQSPLQRSLLKGLAPLEKAPQGHAAVREVDTRWRCGCTRGPAHPQGASLTYPRSQKQALPPTHLNHCATPDPPPRSPQYNSPIVLTFIKALPKFVPGPLQPPSPAVKCRPLSLQTVSTSTFNLLFAGPGSSLPNYPQSNPFLRAKGPATAFPLQNLPDFSLPQSRSLLLWVLPGRLPLAGAPSRGRV